MPKLIVANWKLNPPTAAGAKKLFADYTKIGRSKNAEVVVCPPFPYIGLAPKGFKHGLGAQDVFWVEKGAYTGEVSSQMLASLKAKYVIIGHSERRAWLNETDEVINKKVEAALKARMTVILCVGENADVRRTGLNAALQFVEAQLRKDLAGFSSRAVRAGVIVAYEPIWAIGTGQADKPEETVEMAKLIHKLTGSRVLYGGSVNSKNAREFLAHKEIDGALVGGASLTAKEFSLIIEKSK
jgi:triosephosphate isomerase (TIM)